MRSAWLKAGGAGHHAVACAKRRRVRAHAGTRKTKRLLGHKLANIHRKNVEIDGGKMRKHGGRARDSEAGACAGVGAAATFFIATLYFSPSCANQQNFGFQGARSYSITT